MLPFDVYQQKTGKTARSDFSDIDTGVLPLINWVMGLVGEAGELADNVKKHIFHGHDLDKEAVKKELGDVLWYLARTADELGISLEEVATHNIDKLNKRYQNGSFTKELSRNREEYANSSNGSVGG